MSLQKGGEKEREKYSKRSFESHKVILHAMDGLFGDDSLAILQLGSYVGRFPFDGYLYAV